MSPPIDPQGKAVTTWHLKFQAVPTLPFFTCRCEHRHLCAAETRTPITAAGEVELVNLSSIVFKTKLDIARVVLLPAFRDFGTRGLVHTSIGDSHPPDILACTEIRNSLIRPTLASDSELAFRLALGKAVPVPPSRRQTNTCQYLLGRGSVHLRKASSHASEGDNSQEQD